MSKHGTIRKELAGERAGLTPQSAPILMITFGDVLRIGRLCTGFLYINLTLTTAYCPVRVSKRAVIQPMLRFMASSKLDATWMRLGACYAQLRVCSGLLICANYVLPPTP